MSPVRCWLRTGCTSCCRVQQSGPCQAQIVLLPVHECNVKGSLDIWKLTLQCVTNESNGYTCPEAQTRSLCLATARPRRNDPGKPCGLVLQVSICLYIAGDVREPQLVIAGVMGRTPRLTLTSTQSEKTSCRTSSFGQYKRNNRQRSAAQHTEHLRGAPSIVSDICPTGPEILGRKLKCRIYDPSLLEGASR